MFMPRPRFMHSHVIVTLDRVPMTKPRLPLPDEPMPGRAPLVIAPASIVVNSALSSLRGGHR
ncbi:hypothetical protein CFB89_25965 [Burkholderia sp. AU16741]|nr:hypothetical protein CFB89_25965 [Burkholderia sp. AU16741]